MTERIDHVGEARACEEAGLAVMREMGADLPPHMEAVMQFDLARLHAQLALVEQQRLANFIAIYNANAEAEIGYASEGFDFAFIADRIRDGLGL